MFWLRDWKMHEVNSVPRLDYRQKNQVVAMHTRAAHVHPYTHGWFVKCAF